MNQIPFSELVAKIGQAAVADAFGISPAAIHKALRMGRQIFVTVHENGTYTAHELRPFPSSRAQSTSDGNVRGAQSIEHRLV